MSDKLNQMAEEYAKKIFKNGSRPYNTSKKDAEIDFIAGALSQEARIKGLVEALESICGNRCAEQNPCEAKEAIRAYKGEA